MTERRENVTAIITSAAYVDTEIAAEFGRLPPTFLPMGHRRLFAWQIEQLRKVAARVVLTLPESYRPSAWDLSELRGAGVEILFIPDGLALGESLLQALILANAFERVLILHGDTLFLDPLPHGTDWVSVATARGGYAWGAVDATGAFVPRRLLGGASGITQSEQVLTGLFAFSSGTELARALVVSRGNFLASLNDYARYSPLQSRVLSQWLDFGHLQTFYRSRAAITTARAFNTVRIEGNTVAKSGSKSAKIRAESAWFAQLPAPLRLHTPAYLGEEVDEAGRPQYRLSYEFNPTLHELYVCGSLEPETWRTILSGCIGFLELCRAHAPANPNADVLDELVLRKTASRLEELRANEVLGLEQEWRYAGKRLPTPLRIAEETASFIARSGASMPGVMHGDLCFPNMFFDFRQGLLKVIDPRGGARDNENSIFGELLYDLSKLNHSIEGYDLILADRYMLRGFDERDVLLALQQEGAPGWMRELSRDFGLGGHQLGDPLVTAMTIQLFLSMLPLHADRPDRQKAFLANSLRLFASLESVGGLS